MAINLTRILLLYSWKITNEKIFIFYDFLSDPGKREMIKARKLSVANKVKCVFQFGFIII